MTLTPHASGALWIPEARTALIADAHLGYGWAQRRRGALGPVRDHRSRAKLAAVIEELRPDEVVFLGDAVHAPGPAVEERAAIEELFAWIRGTVQRVVVVPGNHDRGFAEDFPTLGEVVRDCWRREGLIAVHGDQFYSPASDETVIAGHFHPSLSITDSAGVKQRVRVFLKGEGIMVLPAFSPFSAGLNLSRGVPSELESWIGGRNVGVIAATGRRTVPLGPLHRLIDPPPRQRDDTLPHGRRQR